MNNLYEFGGSADVIIKIKRETNIGGVEYVENEPYTILKDVSVSLEYEDVSSEISAKKPIISNRLARPYRIVINNVPLTEKICNLIATKNNSAKYTKTRMVKAISNDGIQIFLPSAPINKNIFIYDQNFNKIGYEKIESDIIIGKFIINKEYLVSYEEELIGAIYNFETPFFPYFSLEISGKGNKDKCTNSNFMKFDAVSLVAVPSFDMASGSLLNTPLAFSIIYERQIPPILVFNN